MNQNMDLSDIDNPLHYSCECGVTILGDSSDPFELTDIWCPNCGDKMDVKDGWVLVKNTEKNTEKKPERKKISAVGDDKVWIDDGTFIPISEIRKSDTMEIK